jgi:predicted aspartyl protease
MRAALLLLVFLCAALSAAAKDSCPPLAILSSVYIKFGIDGRVYAPVKINNVPKSMLVDTGGFFTEITQATAEELALSARTSRLALVGIAGDITRKAVRANFALGKFRSDNMDFMVMPGTHRLAADMPDVAGILAPNLLQNYDLDLDFGRRKMNLISQNHCEGRVVYWPASSVAVVPVAISGEHIVFPVKLDGQRLNALLDTGASISMLNLDIATRQFRLTPGSANTPVAGSLPNPQKAQIYTHRFKSLSLEGVIVANPKLRLVPDLVRLKLRSSPDRWEGGTRIASSRPNAGLSDLILGMDVLRHLHLYIAYKERRLYLTAASEPLPGTDNPKQ